MTRDPGRQRLGAADGQYQDAGGHDRPPRAARSECDSPASGQGFFQQPVALSPSGDRAFPSRASPWLQPVAQQVQPHYQDEERPVLVCSRATGRTAGRPSPRRSSGPTTPRADGSRGRGTTAPTQAGSHAPFPALRSPPAGQPGWAGSPAAGCAGRCKPVARASNTNSRSRKRCAWVRVTTAKRSHSSIASTAMIVGKALPTRPTTDRATRISGRLSRTVTRYITATSIQPP